MLQPELVPGEADFGEFKAWIISLLLQTGYVVKSKLLSVFADMAKQSSVLAHLIKTVRTPWTQQPDDYKITYPAFAEVSRLSVSPLAYAVPLLRSGMTVMMHGL